MILGKSTRTFGMTLAAGTLVLSTTSTAFAFASAAGSLSSSCVRWSFKEQVTDRGVSAELDYTGDKKGMLRARATGVGAWEKFIVCDWTEFVLGTHYYRYSTIFSEAAQKYVSVENDYTGADAGMLRARSSSIGPWEKFWFEKVGLDQRAFKALVNDKYVSAELAYTGSGQGMLRARSSSIGAWEKFDVWQPK